MSQFTNWLTLTLQKKTVFFLELEEVSSPEILHRGSLNKVSGYIVNSFEQNTKRDEKSQSI